MNYQKNIRDIADAMYDRRFVTVNLTDGRTVTGRISNISDISFSIGLLNHKNRVRIDRVESVKMH